MQAIRLSVTLNRGTTTDIGVDTFISTIGSDEEREYTDKLRSGIFNGNVTEKKYGGVFLEKTMWNFLLPRSLPTEAFTKFHERPDFLLKSEGSLLSRRLKRVVAKKQIHIAFEKETINIYFLFIGRPFCDLISAEIEHN